MEEYNASKTKPGVLHGGEISVPSELNYGKFLLDTFRKYGDKVAVIDGSTGEQITFNEIAKQMVSVAASLTSFGIKRGDVVAICSENRMEFLVTCYAIIYIGAVANFINKGYTKGELAHTISISKPKYAFLSPETYKTHFKALSVFKLISRYFVFGKPEKRLTTTFEELVKNNEHIMDFKPADIRDGSQTAIITYSSGTTGLPKGVKWTHRGLIIAAIQPIAGDKDLQRLMLSPWSNTMGYMMTNDYLTSGQTVVTLNKFQEEQFLQTIEKYKVGCLVAVPPLIVILTKSMILKNYDVSSVEIVLCGGAPVELAVIEEFKKRFPKVTHFLNLYGMSEATGGISYETETKNKPGSIGKVIPGIMAKVVDIESRKVLGPNQHGEICINGPALFGGYLGQNSNDDYDEEGFYKTGDVAYYDEDGYLFIVDRLKELIKYKAHQVSPSELEAVLLQHSAVKDAGVIGIPDPVGGELPLAFVVKQPGGIVSEKEIIDFVTSKVAPWKRLRGGVRFVSEIPKNATGKILRRQLRNMLKKSTSKL